MSARAKSAELFVVLFYESVRVLAVDLDMHYTLRDAVKAMGDGIQDRGYMRAEVVYVDGPNIGKVAYTAMSNQTARMLASRGIEIIDATDRMELLEQIRRGDGYLGMSRYQSTSVDGPVDLPVEDMEPA